jgi:putative heme iron utilization protein
MRKTIDAIWEIFLMIWTVRNGELHGKDYDEQRKIALAMTQEEVSRVYENAKHYVNDEENAILHSCPLEQILNWTKSHLDVYLATVEVILEQNVDPG